MIATKYKLNNFEANRKVLRANERENEEEKGREKEKIGIAGIFISNGYK